MHVASLTSQTVRVALLTPFALPSVRGNAITVSRIVRGLSSRGVDLRLWDLSVTPEARIEREVEAYGPTLVHGFHAYRVGPLAWKLARTLHVPLLVTITGTDANHDLFDRDRSATVRRVLEESAGVTVFHESLRARIAAALPGLGAKIAVIPQSVVLDGGEPFPLAERVALPPGAAVFLFPAGIRMVKAPRFPLGPFEQLVLRQPEVRLLYAGPVLDPEEGERLLSALNGRSWATYLGPVPHAQMRSLLEAADVVLNCSISEGGMANSVLEAMALGRPVLASDIEGNRSLVEHEVTGLLFQGPDEFGRSAERLIDDPGLRRRLGLAGREKVGTLYPPEREITGYLAEYHRLAPAPCRLGGAPGRR